MTLGVSKEIIKANGVGSRHIELKEDLLLDISTLRYLSIVWCLFWEEGPQMQKTWFLWKFMTQNRCNGLSSILFIDLDLHPGLTRITTSTCMVALKTNLHIIFKMIFNRLTFLNFSLITSFFCKKCRSPRSTGSTDRYQLTNISSKIKMRMHINIKLLHPV